MSYDVVIIGYNGITDAYYTYNAYLFKSFNSSAYNRYQYYTRLTWKGALYIIIL